jgi:hypothetical protein
MGSLQEGLERLDSKVLFVFVVVIRPFGYLSDGDTASLTRYTKALEHLKTLVPGSYIVILTGGYEPDSPSTPTEKRPVSLADECKKFLIDNGIPESAIIADPCAFGTLDETEKVIRIIDREKIRPFSIYDVTDSVHSKRTYDTWGIAPNFQKLVHNVEAPRCMPPKVERKEPLKRIGYRYFAMSRYSIPRVRLRMRDINRKYAQY